jgi:hypothetical protein
MYKEDGTARWLDGVEVCISELFALRSFERLQQLHNRLVPIPRCI